VVRCFFLLVIFHSQGKNTNKERVYTALPRAKRHPNR
jgi:hypothetical protein